MDFEIIQHSNGSVVLSKASKLTALNTDELKEVFQKINRNNINSIVFDLTETKYCDSSGLSAVLLGNRLCKDTNGKFILCGLQSAVLKVIQIAQLDKVITITENQEAALNSL